LPPFCYCLSRVPLTRLIASLFIVCYLTAVIGSAVPAPDELDRVTGERDSRDDKVARLVRPTLDALQHYSERGNNLAWRALKPVRQTVVRPLRAARLAQRWRMFAQPPRVNGYVAVQVLGQSPSGEIVTRSAQVLPSLDARVVKGLTYYRLSFFDKALSNALASWHRNRPGSRNPTDSDFGPDVLATIARYFGPRISASFPEGVRPQRVEVWEGYSRMPSRGDDRTPDPTPPLSALPNEARLGQIVKQGSAGWTLRAVFDGTQR
jgi:hypothetical protein